MLILGEMGIGNTTADAITAVLSGQDLSKLVGFGTGLVSEENSHKQQVIEQAIANRKPNAKDPIELLSKIGGLEIAGMAGAMLAATVDRVPILVDGFIATVSALIADMIAEGASNYMFVGHQSVEPGHIIAAELLGKNKPSGFQNENRRRSRSGGCLSNFTGQQHLHLKKWQLLRVSVFKIKCSISGCLIAR